jgi:hypothetical protein
MSQHKCVGFTLFGGLKILLGCSEILQRSEFVPADSDLQAGSSCL